MFVMLDFHGGVQKGLEFSVVGMTAIIICFWLQRNVKNGIS